MLPGEQLVQVVTGPGQGPHGGPDGLVGDGDLPPLALLGEVVEPHAVAAHGHVPLLQRGHPVVVVQLGVALAADAEQAQVDEAHRGRRHPVPAQAAPVQVVQGLLAQPGQGQGEPEHVRELLGVPLLAPPVVVAVLGPAPGVDPGGLDVTPRVGRDPHVAPGGREHQRGDPPQRARIGDQRAGRVPVPETVRALLAGEAGAARVAAGQPGHGCRAARLGTPVCGPHAARYQAVHQRAPFATSAPIANWCRGGLN